ncbi:PEP-CTERM sorting domain-containing protein [Aquabacterium soli]|nr:PEP-CTERM sorting domain-containing protein [Aquabacterium soli]
MVFKTTSCAVITACLLATLSSSNAHAAISANLSFSDLHFTVIDDTPDDGITSSATFKLATTTANSYTNAGQQDNIGHASDATGLPLTSVSAATPFGLASIGGTSGTVSATLGNSTDLDRLTPPRGEPYADGASESSIVVGNEIGFNSAGMEDGHPFQITLSAGTTIVFEGSYSTSMTISRQQVADLRDSVWGQADPSREIANAWYTGSAAAAVSGYFYSGQMAYDPYKDSFFRNDVLEVFNDLCANCELTDLTSQTSGTFRMSYSNLTGSDLDVNFLFIAGASVAQLAGLSYTPTPPVIPEVPAIPEPSTCALMGLGLLGLGWARRRHAAR